MSKLAWSDVLQPNDRIMYTHVVLETPLGFFTIEWKSYKDPLRDFTIFLQESLFLEHETYIGTGETLEHAKEIVENYLVGKRDGLNKFLS